MTTSFQIAQEADAPAIAAMRAEAAEVLTRTLGPGGWCGTTKLAAIRERIRAADPERLRGQTIYTAGRGGEVVGSVVVTTFLPGFLKGKNWREPKSAVLGVFNLVVHPSVQRTGLGRVLMEGVEHSAASHGIPFVRLDAFAANPGAVAFYRAIGYEERGTIDLRGMQLVLFERDVRT